MRGMTLIQDTSYAPHIMRVLTKIDYEVLTKPGSDTTFVTT
jgi:GTP-dependent phosphoenolpyruvate carboxykinase